MMKTISRPDRWAIVKHILGPRIRHARHRQRLTQQELAERLAGLGLKLSRPAIAKIESGRRHVYDLELLFLIRALQVPVDWLLPVRTGPRRQPGNHNRQRAAPTRPSKRSA